MFVLLEEPPEGQELVKCQFIGVPSLEKPNSTKYNDSSVYVIWALEIKKKRKLRSFSIGLIHLVRSNMQLVKNKKIEPCCSSNIS